MRQPPRPNRRPRAGRCFQTPSPWHRGLMNRVLTITLTQTVRFVISGQADLPQDTYGTCRRMPPSSSKSSHPSICSPKALLLRGQCSTLVGMHHDFSTRMVPHGVRMSRSRQGHAGIPTGVTNAGVAGRQLSSLAETTMLDPVSRRWASVESMQRLGSGLVVRIRWGMRRCTIPSAEPVSMTWLPLC